MPHLEVTCDVTRADWIAANESLMLTNPYWRSIERRNRRRVRSHMAWILPAMVVAGAWEGELHSAMREGAISGFLIALLIIFGLSRLDVTSKARTKAMEQIRRMDFGSHLGIVSIRIDDAGALIKTPARELKLSWAAVAVHDIGDYILLSHGGSDGTIMPKRAFASPTNAAAFVEQAAKWWRAGQLPASERLARYLADRDLPCLNCQYNLRGLRGESCPECGQPLALDKLLAAKQ